MITSHGNKGIREVIQLVQKAKARKAQGLFIVEGVKMFLEAPAERIKKIYISESFSKQTSMSCKKRMTEMSDACEIVTDELFRKMSDTKTPQGVLCVMQQYQYDLEKMLAAPAPLLVLLEGIQDPGNLGTIVRSAEGAGVSGIVMSADTVDIYNPKTIRSTMGSVYRMPFLYTERLEDTIRGLQKRNVAVYAAHLQGAKIYDSCDCKKGTAFLIGNEANGLRQETAECADAAVKIPMLGKVESLNAAVAASLLLYEAARQRRGGRIREEQVII